MAYGIWPSMAQWPGMAYGTLWYMAQYGIWHSMAYGPVWPMGHTASRVPSRPNLNGTRKPTIIIIKTFNDDDGRIMIAAEL